MAIEDEDGTCDLIVDVALYERCRAVVRAAPLVRALGRPERRGTTINVVVTELAPLESAATSAAEIHSIGDPAPGEGDHDELGRWRAARARAVSELRAVAPAGHSFGRRGR